MKISFITLFPELIESYLSDGLLKRAQKNNLMSFEVLNLRDEAVGNYKSVDDTVYGGSDGQLIEYDALEKSLNKIQWEGLSRGGGARVIYVSPQGQRLNQSKVIELSRFDHLILISGRYAGIDQRFIKAHVQEEISIGDYVLSGGELASLVVTEAVSRHIEGVVGKTISVEQDSFAAGLLEAPQFTKPAEIAGLRVPSVLTQGNHQLIAQWKNHLSVLVTLVKRRDLIDSYLKEHVIDWRALNHFYTSMSAEDRAVLQIEGLESALDERAKGFS